MGLTRRKKTGSGQTLPGAVPIKPGVILAALLLFMPVSTGTRVCAGTQGHMTISQMIQDGRDVYLYVNELDEKDMPVLTSLEKDSLLILSDSGMYEPESLESCRSGGEGLSCIFCVDISSADESADEKNAEQIRSILSYAVSSMGEKDRAQLIVSGPNGLSGCPMTDDKEQLKTAIQALQKGSRTEDGFWQCLKEALESWKEQKEDSGRAAVILFTDGGTGGAGDENADEGYDLRLLSSRVRIPVYVAALDHDKQTADFSEASRFARQSGGCLVMEGNGSPEEAYRQIRDILDNTSRVLIRPASEEFGRSNTNWKAVLTGEKVSSGNGYVFSLEETGQGKIETGTDSDGKASESEADREAVAEQEVTRTPRDAEGAVQNSQESAGAESADSESSAAGTRDSRENETEEENGPDQDRKREPWGFAEQMKSFITENLFIFIAALMVVIALVILIVVLARGRKNRKGRLPKIQEYDDPSYSSFATGGSVSAPHSSGSQGIPASASGLEKTIDEYAAYSADSEKTVDEYSMMDNEKTVAGPISRGIRLAFYVSFCGRTQTIERVVVDKLIVGRGEKSDVDVVLGLRNDDAKQTSREHVVITNRIDGLFVKDNGSRNGTVLNGKELHGEMPLRNEDVLQMGKSIVQIRIDQSSL